MRCWLTIVQINQNPMKFSQVEMSLPEIDSHILLELDFTLSELLRDVLT